MLALQNRPISHIDIDNDYFSYTCDDIPAPLSASIAAVGIINPPITRPQGDSLVPVCGMRRLRCARELDWKEIEIRVLDPSTVTEEDAFFLNLYDNYSHRQHNHIEIARIIHSLLHHFSWTKEQVADKVLSLFDNNAHVNSLNHYLKLLELDDPLQTALLKDKITPQTALTLAELPQHDRIASFDLLRSCKMNTNQQKQFFQMLRDLAKNKNITIAELCSLPDLLHIANSAELNEKEKGKQLIDLLRHLRFPTITAMEKSFAESNRELHLPSHMHMNHPPYFEGEKYEFNFSISSPQELAETAKKLLNISQSDTLKSLFELL